MYLHSLGGKIDTRTGTYNFLVKIDINETAKFITTAEKNTFFTLRDAVKCIFGNELLLINEMHFQCPLCGKLVLLGTINKLYQNVIKHIESFHKQNCTSFHKHKCCQKFLHRLSWRNFDKQN